MKIQEQLRQDLLAIFGFKNCKFGKFNYGNELDILWVEILNVKSSYTKNLKELQIELELSYATPINKGDICFLNDRLEISKHINKNRITLDDDEDSINYNKNQNEFKRVIKYATYIISEEFNTERIKIKDINFNYEIWGKNEERK